VDVGAAGLKRGVDWQVNELGEENAELDPAPGGVAVVRIGLDHVPAKYRKFRGAVSRRKGLCLELASHGRHEGGAQQESQETYHVSP
jgi:hypothetical protein